MLNLKNIAIMKKIMTLAVIALASVVMVSCCGQPKQKQGACGEACCQPKTECVECEKKAECPKAACAECEKKAECQQACPQAQPAQPAQPAQ